MLADVFDGRLAVGNCAIELQVFEFLQNVLEGGARLESHPDEIGAADEARRTHLGRRHLRHRVAAEVVEAEVRARGERVHPADFEQLVEALFA